MEVQQLVRIARRGGAQEGQEGRQERRAAARAQVRAAGVSAEESGIYVSFPGCQASASWCTWGRTCSWRPAGDCWTPLSFYAASGSVKATRLCGAPRTPWCRQSSAATDALASVQRRVAAVRGAGSSPGGSSSNALDVTTAERARAPPQPLLMVAKWSGVAGVHLVAPVRLLERPRVEI